MTKKSPPDSSISPRVQAALLGFLILVCAFALPHITPIDPFARGILVLLLSLSSTILLTGFLKSSGAIAEKRYTVTGAAAIFLVTASLLTYLTQKHVDSELKRQDQLHQREQELQEREYQKEQARLAGLAKIAENNRLAKEELIRQEQKIEKTRALHTEISARLDLTRRIMDESLAGASAAAKRHADGKSTLLASTAAIRSEYERLSDMVKLVMICNPAATPPASRLPSRSLNAEYQDVDIVTLINQAWRHHDPGGPYQDSTGSLAAVVPQFTVAVFTAADPFVSMARPAGGRGTLIPRGGQAPPPPPTPAEESARLLDAVTSINSKIKKGWEQIVEHDLVRLLPDGKKK